MSMTFLIFVVLVPVACCETACGDGFYGERCDKPCNSNCRPRANHNTFCDKVTGDCLEGCVSGWCGDKCNIPCSKNCIDHVCTQTTGQCTKGCQGNYKGDLCEVYGETTNVQPTKDPTTTDPLEETHSGNNTWIVVGIVFGYIAGILTGIIGTLAVPILTRMGYILGKRSVTRSGGSDVDTERLWPTQNPSKKERNMFNDLHDASTWGDLSRVKSILSNGQVDLNRVDEFGRTPFMVSARQGQKEVFDFFLAGDDLLLIDIFGNNMLHSACHGGNIDIVKSVLLRRVLDINGRDTYGRTAVMMAARGGYRDVFDLLVTKEANLSLVDNGDNTVLHVASLGGNIGLVEDVLSHQSVDINARNNDGKTAAMLSKEMGRTVVYEHLVSLGCGE